MRKLLILIIFLLSSSLLMANGLSLNSIGPRALGMGGAMVGLANDPTAIYWNPGGLAGQKTQVYVFATDIIPFGTYKANSSDFGYPSGLFSIDAKTKTHHYISPNLFASYSMNKLNFGLGVFVPAGLGVEWDGSDLMPLSGDTAFNWKSKIYVINISPTISYMLTNELSIGLAGNIYYGSFDMDQPFTLDETNYFQYSESSTGMGYGLTIGSLYKFSDVFQFGATFRTKVNVTMSGEAENPALQATGSTKSDFDRDVGWPLWAAFGIAFKPMDKLTLTADAQYSQWSKSEDEFVTEYKNQNWNDAGVVKDTLLLEWKDCTQIRLGAEYKANEQLAFRMGYYYDPAPAPDKTLTILFPSSTNNVLTGGIGYTMNNIHLDFGLEYLFGKERDVSLTDHNMPGKHKLDIFAFSLGVGIGL